MFREACVSSEFSCGPLDLVVETRQPWMVIEVRDGVTD